MDANEFINTIQQPIEITWSDMTKWYPQFMQWVVQKFGPLPDGAVKTVDYEKFRSAYLERTHQDGE